MVGCIHAVRKLLAGLPGFDRMRTTVRFTGDQWGRSKRARRTGFVLLFTAACVALGCGGEPAPSEEPDARGSGGADGTGGSASDPGCAGLPASECSSTPGCEPLRAYAQGEASPHVVGCRFSGVGDDFVPCNDLAPCGYPSSGEGECLLFTTNCLPDGWTMDVSCDDRPDCAAFRGGDGGAGGSDG